MGVQYMSPEASSIVKILLGLARKCVRKRGGRKSPQKKEQPQQKLDFAACSILKKKERKGILLTFLKCGPLYYINSWQVVMEVICMDHCLSHSFTPLRSLNHLLLITSHPPLP